MKRPLLRPLFVLPSLALSVLVSGAVNSQGVLPYSNDSRGLPTLAPMIAQVSPGVVNIAVTQASPGQATQSGQPGQESPLQRDPFWRRFFGESEGRPRGQSAGSGVIVDATRGLVLTNNHVIASGGDILVTLKDRRQLKAQLVGTDPATDIALIRVPAERLTAVTLGDSDALQVGDFAVAIGNPFGIGQTVTSGIVSALGRSGLGIEGYEDFIQTDASINPGNSGGALVNLRGELIGINTAILAPSGGNVGIGFAVPTNMARLVMEQLVRFGEVRRGRLGVSSADITPDIAKQLNLSVTEGAVIIRVEKNSAAERAGLREKDIVVATGGRRVRSGGDLRNRIGLTPVGEDLELSLLRDGRSLSVRARIAELASTVAIPGSAVPQLSGARIANIEPGTPLHGTVEGVLVTAIDRGTPAYQNGLRSGDVVYGIGRKRVRSTVEFLEALRTNERPWRLLLLRGESRVGLVVR